MATLNILVKTQINCIHELDSYFLLLIICTDNTSLQLRDKKDIVLVMLSSNFQAALKTHTTDYKILTADKIADFYEQFEISEARKKVSNEHSQRSSDISHSPRYKKRKVNYASNSQESNKYVKCDNDDGKNHENGKKWCYTCAKPRHKPALVASHNKDKCKFNKYYNNGKGYENCKDFNPETIITALAKLTD